MEKSNNLIWTEDEVWSPAVTSFSISTPRTGTGAQPALIKGFGGNK